MAGASGTRVFLVSCGWDCHHTEEVTAVLAELDPLYSWLDLQVELRRDPNSDKSQAVFDSVVSQARFPATVKKMVDDLAKSGGGIMAVGCKRGLHRAPATTYVAKTIMEHLGMSVIVLDCAFTPRWMLARSLQMGHDWLHSGGPKPTGFGSVYSGFALKDLILTQESHASLEELERLMFKKRSWTEVSDHEAEEADETASFSSAWRPPLPPMPPPGPRPPPPPPPPMVHVSVAGQGPGWGSGGLSPTDIAALDSHNVGTP